MTHNQYPSAPNQQIAMPLEAMPRQELTPDVPFALDVANPKIPREQAQNYGIDRDITAVIALPMGTGGAEQQVALVDYGPGGVLKEPTPEEAAAGKQPEPARFALIGLNYTNSEDYRPYVVLPSTGEVTFGRNVDAHNVQLGIVHNGAISRKKHFSVQTSPDSVVVADRGSGRGTKIIGNELPKPVEAAPEEEPDIEDTLRRPVGALGLSGAMEASSSRTPEGSQNTGSLN